MSWLGRVIAQPCGYIVKVARLRFTQNGCRCDSLGKGKVYVTVQKYVWSQVPLARILLQLRLPSVGFYKAELTNAIVTLVHEIHVHMRLAVAGFGSKRHPGTACISRSSLTWEATRGEVVSTEVHRALSHVLCT
jgi:hypothetical protein